MPGFEGQKALTRGPSFEATFHWVGLHLLPASQYKACQCSPMICRESEFLTVTQVLIPNDIGSSCALQK